MGSIYSDIDPSISEEPIYVNMMYSNDNEVESTVNTRRTRGQIINKKSHYTNKRQSYQNLLIKYDICLSMLIIMITATVLCLNCYMYIKIASKIDRLSKYNYAVINQSNSATKVRLSVMNTKLTTILDNVSYSLPKLIIQTLKQDLEKAEEKLEEIKNIITDSIFDLNVMIDGNKTLRLTTNPGSHYCKYRKRNNFPKRSNMKGPKPNGSRRKKEKITPIPTSPYVT
ncbi:transmembrane protein [Feline paramyxovirus 163]|uniref:transmembrane protein n=1 Tax=Feline paramyxovirus 163 TaxID=2486281 RepID=UPI0012A31D0D|nr:transmembrane protein [Feline paramyxovirus 163]BBG92173.1 transmembrane protein [Feline paramyxovirus 163]